MAKLDGLNEPCDEWVSKLIALNSGELSHEDRSAVLDHLSRCRACQEAYHDFNVIDASLDLALLDASPALRDELCSLIPNLFDGDRKVGADIEESATADAWAAKRITIGTPSSLGKGKPKAAYVAVQDAESAEDDAQRLSHLAEHRNLGNLAARARARLQVQVAVFYWRTVLAAVSLALQPIRSTLGSSRFSIPVSAPAAGIRLLLRNRGLGLSLLTPLPARHLGVRRIFAREHQRWSINSTAMYQAGIGRPVLDNVRRNASSGSHPIATREQSLLAAIQLIEEAPPLQQPHSDAIVISWQNGTSFADLVPTLRQEWVSALRLALGRGWDVIHLIRDTQRRGKSLAIVKEIRALLGTAGLYTPFLLPMGDEREVLDDYVFIPHVGAVTLHAYGNREPGRPAALLNTAGDGLFKVSEELAHLRAQANPIYERIFPRMSSAFSDAVADAEEMDGERCLVMDGLGETTIPRAIYERRAQEVLAQGCTERVRQLVDHALKNHERRAAAIERCLATWRFRDVCSRSAIQRLVREGCPSADDIFRRLGAPALTRDDRVAQLRHVLALLEHPNYELILLDDDEADLYHTFYLAKANKVALIEFWPIGAQGQREQVDVEISEPSIVAAFQSSPFWTQLDALPPSHKKGVKGFLTEQLNSLLDNEMVALPV